MRSIWPKFLENSKEVLYFECVRLTPKKGRYVHDAEFELIKDFRHFEKNCLDISIFIDRGSLELRQVVSIRNYELFLDYKHESSSIFPPFAFSFRRNIPDAMSPITVILVFFFLLSRILFFLFPNHRGFFYWPACCGLVLCKRTRFLVSIRHFV